MQFNIGKFNIGKFNRIDLVTYLAMAGLTGSDGLSSSSVRVQHITINVSGSGLIEGAVVRTIKTSVAFIGQGELHSGSIKVLQGQATVGGEGALDADLAIYVLVSAELTGAFDVDCRAEGVGIAIAEAILEGIGDIRPTTIAVRNAMATYLGMGRYFALPKRTTFPTVEVIGEANIFTYPYIETTTYVDFTGKGGLQGRAVKVLFGEGKLLGTSEINAFGGILWEAVSELTGTSVLEASASVIILGVSHLNGKGEIVVIPFAIYMPPFVTIPTKMIIIDVTTVAMIEDTRTRVEVEDNTTKVVFI